MSRASRAVLCQDAARTALNAPRKWPEMERDGDASASMAERLAPLGADAQAVAGYLSSARCSAKTVRALRLLAPSPLIMAL